MRNSMRGPSHQLTNVKLANFYRRNPSNHNKLFSNAIHQIGITTITVFNSWTSAIDKERSRDFVSCSDTSKYTPLEVHAELVHAISLALLAGVSAMRMEFKSVPTLIKAGIHGKMAHSAIKKCEFLFHHPNHVAWEGGRSSYPSYGPKGPPGYDNIYNNFRTGILIALAGLHLGIAYAPKVINRVLELVGIRGDKLYGLECLVAAGDVKTILPGDDFDQFPNVYFPAAALGIAGYFCAINHYLGLGELSPAEANHVFTIHDWTAARDPPDSLGVLMGNAFKEQLKGDFVSALNAYDDFIGCQSKIRQLHFMGIWQKIWLHAIRLEFEECFELSMILKNECFWSPTLFNFCSFCFGLAAYNMRQDHKRARSRSGSFLTPNAPQPNLNISPANSGPPSQMGSRKGSIRGGRRRSSFTPMDFQKRNERRKSSVIITGLTEELIRKVSNASNTNITENLRVHDDRGYIIKEKVHEEMLYPKPEEVEITKELLSSLLKKCIKGKKNFGGKIAFHEYLVSIKAKFFYDILEHEESTVDGISLRSGVDLDELEYTSSRKWGKDVMLPFLDLMYVFNGFNLASWDTSNQTLDFMIDFIEKEIEELAGDAIGKLSGERTPEDNMSNSYFSSSGNFLTPDYNREKRGSRISLASIELDASSKPSKAGDELKKVDKIIKQMSLLDFYKGVCMSRKNAFLNAETSFRKVLQNETLLKSDENYSYLINLTCFEMALLTRSMGGMDSDEGRRQIKSWMKRGLKDKETNVFHKLVDYRFGEILFEMKHKNGTLDQNGMNRKSSSVSNISGVSGLG